MGQPLNNNNDDSGGDDDGQSLTVMIYATLAGGAGWGRRLQRIRIVKKAPRASCSDDRLYNDFDHLICCLHIVHACSPVYAIASSPLHAHKRVNMPIALAVFPPFRFDSITCRCHHFCRCCRRVPRALV